MPYEWSAQSGRYRDLSTGRALPASTVRNAIDTVVSVTGDRLKALAGQLKAGTLSIPDFQFQMQTEMRGLHLATAAAVRGGWAQMAPSDHGWVGQRLSTQYGYLTKFAQDIALGTQPMNGTLEARAALYAEAARSTSREMERRMGALSGQREERSILGPADHCGDCLDATARGWVAIGTLPPVGGRSCKARCHCYIETRAA